jgi:acyl-CoA synthetase (AMP-forming)/AMP-acid ligase II
VARIRTRRGVTFRQVADRVGRLAQALVSLGGQPGEHVHRDGGHPRLDRTENPLAVFEVSVIGVPDGKRGEAVKALMVLRPGESATEALLIEHCKRHLASYKKPQSLEFLPVLPKNAYGKVLKRELRDRYWGDRWRKV